MDAETRTRRDACTRFLVRGGSASPAALLAAIPTDTEPDVYGQGGVVAELEAHVAGLLGKPAAVFLPSGTMAQAATLRVHADARASRTVLWHPTCHLELHEQQAHGRVHQLLGRRVGDTPRLLTLDDLREVAEPVAALLLELPQREIGGQLPAWDDLVAQVGWARERGAAVHLDGARLWEASAGYGRSPAEIAALFDTAYVSFYKGIGALAGCCVAGEHDVVAQVREWRTRLGGTLFGLWPLAASALARLDDALAQMPARHAHAVAIGAALADVDGVTVVPEVPQAAMMHLRLRTTGERYSAAVARLAQEQLVWAPQWPRRTVDPGVVAVELSVDDLTVGWRPDEVARVVRELLR